MPQGSGVGPPWPSGPMQLSARAMMRAVVVLPTPRTPVSSQAWASRPDRMALVRVRTRASWPIRPSNVVGRYLRARTRYAESPGPAAVWSVMIPCRLARARTGPARVGDWTLTQIETRYGCFLPDLTGLARNLSTASLPRALYQVPRQESQERVTI